MRVALLLVLALASSSGCATARAVGAQLGARGVPMDVPGADQAVAIVWGEVYGRVDPPPALRWVTGADLSCDGGRGFVAYGRDGKDCVSGYTLSPFAVSIALLEGQPLSESSLAHELRHAADLRDGILDDGHEGAAWRPLSQCLQEPPPRCGLVRSAELRLRSRGL